jgi:ABC-type transport system involved in multi-copper enzyme maturation permease subunit
MIRVLKAEWLKIRNYPAFWVVMALTALSYPGINYIFYNAYLDITQKKSMQGEVVRMLVGNPFRFPETFHTAGYFSSFFVFIPAIVVIMLITNEFTYKTNRQNIIDGWSRNEFLFGKFLDVVLITVMVTLLYFIVALGIGFSSTPAPVKNIWSKSHYIPLFALQTFSQLSLAFMTGFLVRRSFIALGIFVFYYIILENIAVNLLKLKADDIGRYLPLEISDRLIPVPAFLGKLDEKSYAASLAAVTPHIAYTIGITALVWLFCYWVNRKRDL